MIKYDKTLDVFTYRDGNYHRILNMLIDKQKIEEIENNLYKLGISDYIINKNYKVDVFEDVDISQKGLTKIPFKFGKIDGNFDCSFNKLDNLVNSPDEVSGFFDCSLNGLYSLIGGPRIAMTGYYCSDNNLTDLEGFPEKVYVIFNAERNKLKTLKGTPEELVCRDFTVAQNDLINLHNGPKRGFNFDCSQNDITTLLDGIKELEGIFDCSYNKLTSLMGKPKCNMIQWFGNKITNID